MGERDIFLYTFSRVLGVFLTVAILGCGKESSMAERQRFERQILEADEKVQMRFRKNPATLELLHSKAIEIAEVRSGWIKVNVDGVTSVPSKFCVGYPNGITVYVSRSPPCPGDSVQVIFSESGELLGYGP